ncbi:MAG TPA: glycine cleavage system aminomethyltransferase GcvT [Gaiellaceae bacterium]|nr:glycine cleavage system aminomethyltransferase GcvT [Gaiellaceae bacterium]
MQTLRRTPLHDRHVALGARMVPFAGWEMPVQYEGVIPEHRAVRTDAGVFDVSHMGEIEVEGPTARDLLQSTLSNDVDRLRPGTAQYTLLTTEDGGIVDDLIVYRLEECRYLLVVNAANRDPVFHWLKDRELRGSDVRDVSDDYGLLAVQGPRALERLGLEPAKAFTWAMAELDGVEVMVNRTGYTGEPGVELACMEDDAPTLWDAILARGVTPCGLGARDTLRLEVCYPLHGNDIGPQWDAISSGLGWACALDTGFTGAERLREIKAHGPERRLVPFVMREKAIPRQGMALRAADAGEGEVTSGSLSPMLDVGIGLGYVPAAAASPGTELVVDVRGRERRAQVVKKPIYTKEEAA